MFMTDVNDTKIYNLSAGKSLPDVNKNIIFFLTPKIELNFYYSGLQIVKEKSFLEKM